MNDWEKGFNKWREKKHIYPYTDLIKKEVNKVEEGTKSEIKKFEQNFSKPKTSKIEKYIVIGIYVIFLLIAVYLIMASFFPNYLPFNSTTYTISAEDSQLFDNLRSFYIDNNVLGEKLEINGEIIRPIISVKPFNLVFVPKTNIKSQNATLELNFYINGTGGGLHPRQANAYGTFIFFAEK